MNFIKTEKELINAFSESLTQRELLDATKIKRGIGKSRFLFEVATNSECYIIVSTSTKAKMFNIRFNTNIYHTPESLRGKGLGEIFVLLEEGLGIDQEDFCYNMYKVIGGYTSNTKEREIKKIRESFEKSTKRLEYYCKEIDSIENQLESLKRTATIEKDYQDTLYKMLVLKQRGEQR